MKKKNYLKQLMEENKEREREKIKIKNKDKELEIEADHMRAQIPCCWNQRHYL